MAVDGMITALVCLGEDSVPRYSVGLLDKHNPDTSPDMALCQFFPLGCAYMLKDFIVPSLLCSGN